MTNRANRYANRGRLLARSACRIEYPLTPGDNPAYTPRELPMPRPIRVSNLSGLGLLLRGLLNAKLEIAVDF